MKMIFVGDVMLGRLVNEFLRQEPVDYPWGDTLALFREADCRICNLECVISDRGVPWSQPPKAFHFRSDKKNVDVLKAARIDAVSLANNHTLDYEYEAMFEMLRVLDKAGIARAGAGADAEEARRPATLECSSQRVGLIAFTDNEPHWEATDTKAGVFYVPVNVRDPRAGKLLEVVRGVKAEVDFLVVAAHWGPNWGYEPPPSHGPFGRALIDAGADVVFGHSAHIVRGIEVYRGGVILYSTGDFVDDYAVDEIERNDQSFIFLIETERSKIRSFRLYPTVIRGFQARRASGREEKEVAEKMQQLCAEFGTEVRWHDADRCLLWGGHAPVH